MKIVCCQAIPFALVVTTQEGFHSTRSLSLRRCHRPRLFTFPLISRTLDILECCSNSINNHLAFRRTLGFPLAGAFGVNQCIRTASLFVDDGHFEVAYSIQVKRRQKLHGNRNGNSPILLSIC